MQQYMVQIIKNLKEKGYRQLNPESNNVYGRADSDAVYIVVIGSNHNLDSETLKKFNNKILLDVSSDSHIKVNLLNIDRKSTRLNSSHKTESRMPSSA